MSGSDRWKARAKGGTRRLYLKLFSMWLADKLGGSLVTAAFGALAIRVWKSLTDQAQPRIVPQPLSHEIVAMIPMPIEWKGGDVVTVSERVEVLVSVTGTDSLQIG